MKGDKTMAKKTQQGWQCPVCLTVYAPSVEKQVEQADNSGFRIKSIEWPQAGSGINVKSPPQDQWTYTVSGSMIPADIRVVPRALNLRQRTTA
jgi:hypothetical protein